MPLPNIPTIQAVPGGGEFLQAPIYSPTQENVFERLLQLGGQRLENPQQGFAPFEDRARSQFFQNTIPGLAERFTAMGGGQRSSAFQGALGQAGSDLESQLAQLRQNYGQQQEQMALNMLGTGLTPQYNQAYYQPANVSGALGQMAGQTLGTAAPEIISGIASGVQKILGGGGNTNPAKQATEAAGTALGGAAGTLGAAGLTGLTGTATTPATGAATVAGTTAPATGAALGTGTTATGTAAKAAGASTLAGALKAVGAIVMPLAVAGLGGWWVYNLLKKDPSQPSQFPNPFPAGTYNDAQGNRVVSQGNIIRIYDQSGKLIDTTTFAGPNAGRTPAQQPGGRIYPYYGGTKPVGGPYTAT